MSVPRAVASAVIVAVKVALPKLVRVAAPDKSPARVITGDLLMVVALAISPPLMSKLPPSISLLSKVTFPAVLNVVTVSAGILTPPPSDMLMAASPSEYCMVATLRVGVVVTPPVSTVTPPTLIASVTLSVVDHLVFP